MQKAWDMHNMKEVINGTCKKHEGSGKKDSNFKSMFATYMKEMDESSKSFKKMKKRKHKCANSSSSDFETT